MTIPLMKPSPESEREKIKAELEKLARFYVELPRDCQRDALALIEALWRRRHREAAAIKRISERKGDAPRKRGIEVPRVDVNVPRPRGGKKGKR